MLSYSQINIYRCGRMNMEEMLLLDKRTKNLIEDYVPKGDVLEGIVCFFSDRKAHV